MIRAFSRRIDLWMPHQSSADDLSFTLTGDLGAKLKDGPAQGNDGFLGFVVSA